MTSYMYVVAFNKELEDLVNIVANKFPEDAGVQQTKMKIEMANYVSPKAAALGFMSYALKYQPEIAHRDEKFFMEKGMQTPELSHLQLDRKFSAFSQDEKNEMWAKVTVMNQLGSRIIASS
jgi:hypothetical protein